MAVPQQLMFLQEFIAIPIVRPQFDVRKKQPKSISAGYMVDGFKILIKKSEAILHKLKSFSEEVIKPETPEPKSIKEPVITQEPEIIEEPEIKKEPEIIKKPVIIQPPVEIVDYIAPNKIIEPSNPLGMRNLSIKDDQIRKVYILLKSFF